MPTVRLGDYDVIALIGKEGFGGSLSTRDAAGRPFNRRQEPLDFLGWLEELKARVPTP